MTTRFAMRRSPRAGLACVTTIVGWALVAQSSALAQTANDQTAFRVKALAVHNADRALYPISALSLAADSDFLNTGSADWALHLAQIGDLVHSSSGQRNGAGENIFVEYTTGNLTPEMMAKAMVDAWNEEVGKYNYAHPEANFSKTGHFTQVVWNSTTTLGCGYAIGSYTDPKTMTVYNAYYGVCRYTPAGNVAGQSQANVLLANREMNPM